jgi:hypothetical protein
MPTVGSVHVSAALSNVAIKYKNPEFIAELVAPVVPVKKEADRYYVFSREELRNLDALRAAGARANEVSWDVSTSTYQCEEYALAHMLADRIVDNADTPVKPRSTTTEKLTKWINLGYEKRIQALAQSTATVTNNATPGTKWDAASGQTPEADTDIAKTSIRRTAGTNPNTMVMSDPVWQAVKRWLKAQSDVTYDEWIKKGTPPPKLWNLDLIVAGSVENTANEGQSDSISDIWNDNVLVCYREKSPSLDSLSFMYTFRSRSFRVKTWREEARDGQMIETSVVQDEVVCAADAAYLITDTLT